MEVKFFEDTIENLVENDTNTFMKMLAFSGPASLLVTIVMLFTGDFGTLESLIICAVISLIVHIAGIILFSAAVYKRREKNIPLCFTLKAGITYYFASMIIITILYAFISSS